MKTQMLSSLCSAGHKKYSFLEVLTLFLVYIPMKYSLCSEVFPLYSVPEHRGGSVPTIVWKWLCVLCHCERFCRLDSPCVDRRDQSLSADNRTVQPSGKTHQRRFRFMILLTDRAEVKHLPVIPVHLKCVVSAAHWKYNSHLAPTSNLLDYDCRVFYSKSYLLPYIRQPLQLLNKCRPISVSKMILIHFVILQTTLVQLPSCEHFFNNLKKLQQ